MGYNFGSNFKKKARYSAHSRQECRGGCSNGLPKYHHSGEEARYCDQLALLVKGGRIRSYTGQKRYDLHDAHGKAVGYMLVDFQVIRADGILEIHEYKGAMLINSPEFRHKKALFTWCYPHIQYHVVGRKQIVL